MNDILQLLNEAILEDIADAIRERGETSGTYTPAEMAGAIESLPVQDVWPERPFEYNLNEIEESDKYILTKASNLSSIANAIRSKAKTDQTFTPTEMGSAIRGIPLTVGPVQNVTVVSDTATVSFTWTDPEDVVLNNKTYAAWKGTKLVRKLGSMPENPLDGDLVIDSTVYNQYAETAFSDSELAYNQDYYYRFFPYSEEGFYSLDEENEFVGRSWGIKINRPKRTSAILRWNGSAINLSTSLSIYVSGYDSTTMLMEGDSSATVAGETYYLYYTPLTNYCWEDGSTEKYQIDLYLNYGRAYYSVSSTSFTYDGKSHAPTINSTTGCSYTYSSQINAGEYEIIFTLQNNYRWSDSGTGSRSVTWKINPKALVLLQWNNPTLNQFKPSRSYTMASNLSDTTITAELITGADLISLDTETSPGIAQISRLETATEGTATIRFTIVNTVDSNYEASAVIDKEIIVESYDNYEEFTLPTTSVTISSILSTTTTSKSSSVMKVDLNGRTKLHCKGSLQVQQTNATTNRYISYAYLYITGIDAEGVSTTLQTFSVSTYASSTNASGTITYSYSNSRSVPFEFVDLDVSNYTQIGFQIKVTRPSSAATNKHQASAKLTSHTIGISA